MDFTNALRITKGKILITVYVTPSAKTTCFPTGFNKWRTCFEMTVKGKAQQNQANKEVLREMSRFFDIPLRYVMITAGKASREKTVSLQGISQQQVMQHLQEHLHDS